MEKPISLTLKIIGILIGILLLYFVQELISYLLLAFVFSAALRPGVDYLQEKRIPRFLGGIIIFFLIFLLFGLIIYFTFPPLISEFQTFLFTIPKYWENFLLWLPKFELWVQTTPFGQSIQNAIYQYVQQLSHTVTTLIGFASKLLGQILNFVLILVITFYLMIEKNIDEKILSFLPVNNKRREKEMRQKILKYWKLAQVQAGHWLQGYVLLGVIVGTLIYISLSIIGVKYSLILAFLAGILEIIPWLGPVAAGTIGALLALFQGGWMMALWTAFIFFVVQQIENFLIIPLVMKDKVNLDPILTLVVLFVGGKLGGITGMMLAVPVTAILISLSREKT